jgi:hypothetical protein
MATRSQAYLFIILFFITTHQAKCQKLDTLIDVGAYMLHFKIIRGNATPILFESGGGLNANQWDNIVVPVYKATGATIITYDRQGFGGSGIDTSTYNIQSEIKGLEIGLAKMGFEKQPLILVCHSLGAFYSRVYASRHTKLVKGVILLDPRIPSRTDEVFAKNAFESVQRKYHVKDLKGSDLALYYVFKVMVSNEHVVEKHPFPSPIPMLDIMSEVGPYDKAGDNARFKSKQREFVKQGSNRRLIYAKGSAHYIPKSKPQLVANCIVSFYKICSKH